MRVKANYYDGISAQKTEINLYFGPNGLHFPDGNIWRYGELVLTASDKASGQLSYENKNIDGPGITLLFERGIDDPARDYLGRISSKLTGDSHWHFVRWQFVTAGIIGILLVSFYFLYPFLNRSIVAIMPNSWAERAGDLVVEGMYDEYASAVCHSPMGDQALEKLVTKLETPDLEYPLRLEIVDNGIINALTAPGGRIVIFDGLLKNAESVEEVAGVLGHEIGHVYYQHPLQGLVNVLGLSILGSFAGGDAASIAIAGLSLSYSRDFEREADGKGLEILKSSKISAEGLKSFFERQNQKENVLEQVQDLFSTHPLDEERINTISMHINENEPYEVMTSILTEDEWQALVTICDQ